MRAAAVENRVEVEQGNSRDRRKDADQKPSQGKRSWDPGS